MISIKMIFYYVILLFLGWPQIRCLEDADLKSEEIFDQLATASETVVHAIKPNKDSKDFEEQLSSISSSTVHYENSNGFIPMVRSVSPSVLYELDSSQINDYEQERSKENNVSNAVSAQDSYDSRVKKLEEDLAYSSEARIFLSLPKALTNRRSFDLQDDRLNEFELLKVNNDTPAIANYQDFYENVHSIANIQTNSEFDKSSRRPNSERGKRFENHTHNYDWQSQQNNDADIYAQFYLDNNAQDAKKTFYGQEKVVDNYQQQNTANYNELSAAKQNAEATPSSSRTNYEANELAHSGTYGNAAKLSRTRHRFMKPVVVAEPSNHKMEIKFSRQLKDSESDNDEKTLKNSEFSNSQTYDTYNNNNRQRSYQRTEDSEEVSDESTDYSDYIERLRLRAQKNRKRPDSVRKQLSKEHRDTLNESTDEGKYTYNSSKLKSQRQRTKTNPWLNDPSTNHHDESVEDIRHDSRVTSTKTKKVHGSKNTNMWSQISPNLEVSQSNGIELNQLEKPKYIVNLVPVANFDHATALGGSQGFDMSNAMLQNLATVAPIGAFSTSTPLLSTPQSVLTQNLAVSKNLVSTPVPDIVVGQNTFQNPVQTVLLSHPSGPNKIVNTLRATYVPSTMTPVFALTPNLNPALQSLNIHGMQGNVTPQTTFTVLPQPTIQTYPSFLQTPLQATQIQVNSRGLQGQNLINHGNLQVQSAPAVSTLLSSQTMPESRANLEMQSKKNVYPTSGGNFLATASLAVGQNGQKQAANINSYYVQGQNTQLIPTQQNLQELQAQINKQLVKGGRLSGIVLQAADSTTSHSINNLNMLGAAATNAHLPNVGAKTVEIVNPNIKPSPLNVNAYQAMHYPTTVLTTPIPIFSTIASATPQTILHNYMNSLTESGAKPKQVDLKLVQSQQPVFNPINFVPNVDIIKNQNALNNKLSTNEPLQPGLNLVPAMPGGNFFKPHSGQTELIMKPKLTSDLQNYAEEMFKESLKTMYNSQKWNNDRRPENIPVQNNSEASDLAKLKHELQKLKSSLTESKYRDILEAHQSENNIHTSDVPNSSDGKKKLDPLLETLEHLLKTRPAGPIHIYHGAVKPGRKPKLEDTNFAASSNYDFNDDSYLKFLTPPRPDAFRSKVPFHDKQMKKKRPGSRFKNGPRKWRSNKGSNGLETSASNVEMYLDGPHAYARKPPKDFDTENFDYDSRHRSFLDSYPTFTTPTPESLGKILREIKSNTEYDINHPRMHNLLGMLMKNKQLPNRGAQNYFRNKNQLRQFFERDRRRLQQQFYANTFRDYIDKSNIASQPTLVANENVYSANDTAECRSQPVNIELWFLLVPNCTSIMLIVNIILFTAICSTTKIVTSTGASVTSATSTKSKRVGLTHNNPNNQEQSRGTQTIPRIPSPQDINLRLSPHYGNVKVSVIQKVPNTGTNHEPGSHAYGSVPKRPLSYVAPSIHQTESHRSNSLTPYFDMLNNPDGYKAARSIEEDASKSIVSQSHQKLQGIYSPSYNAFYQEKPIELSSFSDFEYSPLANIGKLIPQGVSSLTVQAPVYKMSYPLPKITDYAPVYAPSIPTASSITPSSDKKTQSPRQKDEAIVDMNGKKISVPIIRLQSNLDLSEVPTFESQPFLLSSNYPIESDVGFKFGAGPKSNLALQSSNISPFSSPLSSFQGQVVPIQTANGSPQFPQYKGASIEAYPITNNVPKVQGNYESLYNQPQLHFDKERNDNVQTVNVRQNTAHPPVGTQGILNDAEIINTKNPEPHTPQPDDDDETRDDERYQNSDKEYDSSEEDDVERQPGKHFKASPTESDFKPSTSYPFKEYDEKFGKHRTYSDDDDFEDKPFSSYKNYSSDDDEEEEEDSPSEYHSEYTESSKPSHDSFGEEDEEEEEEEESRKQEKRKEANEDSSEVQPSRRSKYYQKDFEQEFEESYKEELPKEEYVHVKEVPDIDSYIDSSKRQQRNKSRVKQEQSKESKNQESHNFRKNRKVPKTDYRDSTAYGSDISTKTSPKVIYQEFFGYKQPKTEKYSKHAKTEKFSFTKKSPKKNDYLRTAKYYKFNNPKTESEHNSEDKDPYTNSSVNDQKLKKNSSKKTIPRSNVKQLSDSGDGISFYEPSILSGRVRSPTNAEIFRDLTGI
ncbi:PREDICTED: uncharacterized protein LOC108749142 [Trachymyrmex septentrionalis]|uniref:uncharacterized protein LOC108749142 n=1 Tax=Trachymyrmex septentrionalis TaxID=34720 RepID=UPI00084F0C94|nr:PREDICTED: uncharacterized protein LOC108749142 [Trachymyrmex septentrionalis]